jgi:hypothetical protein
MYFLTKFYYFIFSKFLGREEAAALMDKAGMIKSSTRVQKERPVNTIVQNLNRRVASNATHYMC